MSETPRTPAPYRIVFTNGQPERVVEPSSTIYESHQPDFLERTAENFGSFIGHAINAAEAVAEKVRRNFNIRGAATAMLGAAGVAGAVLAVKNGIETNVAEAGASSVLTLGSLFGIVIAHANVPRNPQYEDTGIGIVAFAEA